MPVELSTGNNRQVTTCGHLKQVELIKTKENIRKHP
jgi:hypothetical protein